MPFNRWKSEDTYSYVFRLFERYHEYLNSLYWAHVPASANIQLRFRQEIKKSPIRTTQEAFHLNGPNKHRVAQSLSDYSKHVKEFDNWTRLNAMVAVVSYFETYLSSVVSLAIESDIGILYSVPKRIDGVMILKYSSNSEYAFLELSEKITKGTWPQRISCFKELFRTVPSCLSKYVSELEIMRNMRNKVAHAFGRDIDKSRSRHTLALLPIERLSEDRIMRYMEIIINIAKGIDNQLLTNHIGEYEQIHYYHTIKDQLGEEGRAKQFKKNINRLMIKNRGLKYCEKLLEYYSDV